MPSRRSSILIGLFMICSIALVVDFYFLGGGFLESLLPGLSSLLNILIIPLFPIVIVSLILDRRQAGDSTQPPRRQDEERLSRGIRSASGQPVPRQRMQTRIRRGRRAKRLETIVVEDSERPAAPTRPVQPQPTIEQPRPQPTIEQPRPQLVSSPAVQATTEKSALDVEQQLAAIEQEMAKLEEEMGEPGTEFPTSPLPTEPTEGGLTDTSSDMESLFPSLDLPEEDKSSEIKALDELLARLEQRRRTGSISESTYERLRTRYLKRKAEISSG